MTEQEIIDSIRDGHGWFSPAPKNSFPLTQKVGLTLRNINWAFVTVWGFGLLCGIAVWAMIIKWIS